MNRTQCLLQTLNSYQRKYSVLCTQCSAENIPEHTLTSMFRHCRRLWYRCCILETAFLVLFRALIETWRSLSLLAPGKRFWPFCGVQLSHTKESCPFKCLDTLFRTTSCYKKTLSLRSRNPKVVAKQSRKRNAASSLILQYEVYKIYHRCGLEVHLGIYDRST